MPLTADELLEIIVSLDNEAYHEAQNGHNERADRVRSLKWKVFALMVEMQKDQKKAA